MNKSDNLEAFIDSVVTKNEEDGKNLFTEYVKDKLSKVIQEFTADSAVKFKGDDVYVNGKLVGSIEVDLGDMDSDINFVSSDGKYSKEFSATPTKDPATGKMIEPTTVIYNWVKQQYGVKEGEEKSPEQLAEDQKVVTDASNERIKRWVDIKKTETAEKE